MSSRKWYLPSIFFQAILKALVMLHYNFISQGSFKATAAKVWRVIQNLEDMPAWWPGVNNARIRGVDKTLRTGTLIDCSVKGLLGNLNFTLRVTELKTGRLLRLESNGGLKGSGLCTLEQNDDTTEVKFLWEVATTGWLMNLAGVIIKPILAHNHDKVMAAGYNALKARIES